MNGFNIAQAGHIVNVIPPVDGNAGAPVTAQAFSMKGAEHASILIQLGVTAGTPTSIILKSAATAGGAGVAMPFRYAAQITQGASNDVLGALTLVAATGITGVTPNDNTFYVIEVDASELPDGSPFLQLCVTMPGSSNLVSAVAVLSGLRYKQESSTTVTQ